MTLQKLSKEYGGWQVYKRLLGYLKAAKKAFILAILGNIIYAAASAAMAPAMKIIIYAIEQPGSKYRMWVPLVIIGVFAIRGLGSFLGTYFMATVAREIVHRMRVELFGRLIRLPNKFYDANSSGHLVSKITYNVEQVTGAATNAVTVSLREGLTIIGLLAYMFYENWRLTAMFLIVGPFIGLYVTYITKVFRKMSRRIQTSMGDITHIANETFNGYRVMRVFGGEKQEYDRFHRASEHNITQALKMAFTQAASTPVVQTLISVSIAILVWVGLSPNILADMSTASFIAFIVAATTIAKPIRQLTSVNSIIQKGIAASQDVFSQMDESPEKDSGTSKLVDAKGKLEFVDLNFRYPGSQRHALQSINLSIPAGTSVALVGRSGSGKSTLASLIPRFYDYSDGQILLDDTPVKSLTLESLRNNISIVTQHVTLFNDTVFNNIAYGALRGASLEEVRKAAEAAHALEFIEALPEGFNTVLGENGETLSGGQRQRLAIARALLKDSPILILDEATSALDTHSERHIQEALANLVKGRTTILIAHRLSTIEDADMIVVMEQGEIVEKGTHRQLLEKGGAYTALHQLQFSETTSDV